MESTSHRAIAIVGVGAILPDAPNVPTFWENIKKGRYSVTDVDPQRWDPALYYDPDPTAPDKTYSKIGGWVRDFTWEPMKWHLPVPPRVVDAMDGAQKWAIACTRQALEDFGYPTRALDLDRTAVILGNAMAGEKHYLTALRIQFPEYARELDGISSFSALPQALRQDILRQLHDRIAKHFPEVTEDSMPGELANCIAGRIANLFNFHGPNYVCDAACASAMAAISSAIEGLVQKDFDAVITGGIDRNMGAPTFVKFCKIGALSATGTRPYAEGADGFVMGEGAAIFLMKRLADAERDGDKVYAVIRGMGGSSDGKGKGITAPNPIGQKLAVERAWKNADLSPATVTYVEGHGTSTRVGDVVEVESLAKVLDEFHLPANSVALGSVKSNFGHLKGAAGAAGLLKATLALHNKMLPPSVHCDHPNPEIDFAHSSLFVNTELRSWEIPAGGVRRAGLSAFGFGGTNFHAVLEEYIPHRLNGNGKRSVLVNDVPTTVETSVTTQDIRTNSLPLSEPSSLSVCKPPLRGALLIGGKSEMELIERLRIVEKEAKAGIARDVAPPKESDLRATERLAIDYSDAPHLATQASSALKALMANQPAMWKALRAQGIYRGHGPAPKVAFLYPGQGSQYVNMLKPLCDMEPIVAKTFAEADRVMSPLLGKPLSEFIFVDFADPDAVAKAEDALRQTAITQPAVLATDLALTRMLAAYGIKPDFAMGHSLGEYGALVAVDALPFSDALEAVSARGREMTQVAMKDNGRMAAVFAPLTEIERILKTIDGYVVIANINSEHQAVIGGASDAVTMAMEAFQKAGYDVSALSVSHAFHTSIVAPASEPLRRVLQRLRLAPPKLPIVANTNGEFYPMGPEVVPQMLDILAQQVAAPVQFVKGLQTLYEAGARVFVEVGPKKALQGCAEDVLGKYGDVVTIFTNHPKNGDLPAFNQALCSLYAAGLGRGIPESTEIVEQAIQSTSLPEAATTTLSADTGKPVHMRTAAPLTTDSERYIELGRTFEEVLEREWQKYYREIPVSKEAPVSITGAALGLPGTEHIFDDGNLERILRGDQFIGTIPTQFRQAMVAKHITRLVKSDNGGPTFETITNTADVIKLAGRGGAFDLEKEYGVPAERMAALDRDTKLAIAVGLDALRDAGIPLVMRYKTTSKGTQLPDRWTLPESLRDDTGVIFASAFPGYDAYAREMDLYYRDQARREQLTVLESLAARLMETNGQPKLESEVERRIKELRDEIDKHPYVFDRRFLFRVLSMGHSQFAEFIAARGPNTQVNSACASTTQAIALAEDWIRTGRCRRVIVISADDITSDQVIDWFGAGFLASGAAATDEIVADAALPFDRRRHGMIIGMGAAGFVIESAEAARERGIRPICEVLGTVTANSAFHGTRLDIEHICQVMEGLIASAEKEHGIHREDIAPKTVFVSHETYTPARGGSAAAEIHALRRVFGNSADRIVIANTKGYTGHAMAAGIEDVVAVKALETGIVPPVANFKEVDPELGVLNLSKGGHYPVEYALRLAAGFGSQISLTLLRWGAKDANRRDPDALGYTYRISDSDTWNAWLSTLTTSPKPELEVVGRTLRVRDVATAGQTREPGGKTQTRRVESLRPEPTMTVAKDEKLGGSPAVQTAPVTTSLKQDARPEQTKKQRTAEDVLRMAINMEVAQTPKAPGPPPTARPIDDVTEQILKLVVEKTGYPKDMLDLDLDLEADLGIDTVKQAEMFAAIREIYNIPRDENRKLRDYPTLNHVIRFVQEKRPDLASPASAKATQPIAQEPAVEHPASTAPGVDTDVKERILALVVEKTGYPKEMLDLDLDLEADLGVDTVKQAEMFAAIREIYNIPRDENRKLRDYPTLNHVIRFVYEKRPDLANPMLEAGVEPSAIGKLRTASINTVSEPEKVTTNESAGDEVRERILQLVVEKTGYPKEMLDLDLDLEADLGVDTVKQAEMFAAIREVYNIPRDENRKLRDYPTLAHVIRFVYEKRPDLVAETKPLLTMTQPAQSVGVPTSTPIPPIEIPAEVGNSITDKVLEIVAEKTGYPKEMLDLDLDLEADLGIDTVKQAEMFVAIRSAYNIPRDENLKLRDFPTLAHVIKFAQERAGAPQVIARTAEIVSGTKQVPSSSTKATRTPRQVGSFEAANRVPRRVPVPVLRPPLEICRATAVKLVRGSRVVVMPDKGGVAHALIESLKSRGVEALLIDNGCKSDDLTNLLKTWTAAGPVHGVYWLPALDIEERIEQMDAATWHEAVRVRVKALYTTMRELYNHIGVQGTFLVTGTRLGGQQGYDPAGAVAPLGGAVVGFAKTYKRERIETCVKAVDFEPTSPPATVANRLIDETLYDPGAIEIGYKDDLRWTIGLQEQPAADGKPGMVLDEKTVFAITGAAGSIVSAITSDLASACGGIFYLLDLVPEPAADNPDIERFTRDKEGLKRELFGRIQARGERATPALVEKELAGLERALAARTAIDAVRSAGGSAHYFSVDLSDANSVAKVIQQIRDQQGHIDVLLHAAGLDRSRGLADKPPQEFDLVFDVKSNGFYNLLHAIGDLPLGAAVVFSSIAGRFGNPGQTDYSSANDLLCKIISSFRSTRPATRGIAIDWTAWGGIGMATRGSIPKIMEMAGIDMLPPAAGVPVIRRELTAGDTRGEIVIAQRLGVLLNEWDEMGGIDGSKKPSDQEQNSRPGPMIGKFASAGVFKPLTITTELDPKIQPFLYDHQIDGTPVLPGVMGIEAFAEAATTMVPGWRVEAIEQMDFLAPFKFYRREPRTVTIEVSVHPLEKTLIADCRLVGYRQLTAQKEPQVTTHFTGRLRLTRERSQPGIRVNFRKPVGAVIEANDIYKLYFHGPAYQVIKQAWWNGKQIVGVMPALLPANHCPSDKPLTIAPRLIELFFQTAGIWEIGMKGRMGLPHRIDQISILHPDLEAVQERVFAVVTPNPDSGTFEGEVLDEKGNCYLRVSGYRTIEVPNAIDPESVKKLQAAMSLEPVAA